MTDLIRAQIDLSGWEHALQQLGGPAKESLARSMAVAGGKVLRDEAKARAPVDSGRLRASIYLAYKTDRSTGDRQIYSVSWNSGHLGGAPHGHLIEFGHWRYNKIVNGVPQRSLRAGLKRGRGPQDHEGPGALDVPVWVPARPFLRPALDAAGARAAEAMFARGRERLFEVLADPHAPEPDA
jgi:hypothetical protein